MFVSLFATAAADLPYFLVENQHATAAPMYAAYPAYPAYSAPAPSPDGSNVELWDMDNDGPNQRKRERPDEPDA